MNSFEIITKYLPQAVDKYFFESSKTAILEKGTKFIDVNFDQTGYVKIANILLDGLGDYYPTQQNAEGYVAPSTARPSDPANYAAYAGNVGVGERDGFQLGGTSLTWEIFRLQWVRSKQIRVDHIADEESAGVVIGNLVEEFNRTKVIPEVDAVRFSYIAGYTSAGLGNYASETIAANTIIGKFNTAFEFLTDHEVPEEEQVIFVSPAVMSLIRNTTELAKFLTQGDYRAESGIDFTVEKYGGRPIIVVPSNRFFTDVVLTQNGYRAASSSKVINFMVVSTKAVLPLRKIEYSKIYDENMSGIAGFYGYIFNYLLYHGIIIPQNKVAGFYVSVSETNATTKTNTLVVDTKAGSASKGWKVWRTFTNPAGLRGTLVFQTAAFTLGATVNLASAVSTTASVDNDSFMIATPDVEIAESASGKAYYFALVDAYGKVVAVSGSTSVVQKA